MMNKLKLPVEGMKRSTSHEFSLFISEIHEGCNHVQNGSLVHLLGEDLVKPLTRPSAEQHLWVCGGVKTAAWRGARGPGFIQLCISERRGVGVASEAPPPCSETRGIQQGQRGGPGSTVPEGGW